MHRAVRLLARFAVLPVLLLGCASSRSGPPKEAGLTYVVAYEVGSDECRDGDRITINRVDGSNPEFVAGGTYRVRGTYTLASRDTALMELWVMNGETDTTPSATLRRGTGEFDFLFTVTRPGFPHISLYPVGGGSAFAAVYFGSDDENIWRTAFGE
jgi:hypothetical protein